MTSTVLRTILLTPLPLPVYSVNPSPSTSVVNVLTPSSQAIPASPTASVFGYTLSGGIDVDNNGYPGITFLTLLKFGNSTRIH